jgi:hypothetical protein
MSAASMTLGRGNFGSGEASQNGVPQTMKDRLTLVLILCLVGVCTAASARDGRQGPARQPNGLALTPPMGWNS